jgi:hypothetical protein
MSTPAVVIAAALLSATWMAHRSLDWRIGKRVLQQDAQRRTANGSSGAVAPADAAVEDESIELWRRHQCVSGHMDRYYQAQLVGQKRDFIEALKLRGRPPSAYELACALTVMAQKHPRLLLLPHPTAYRLHSQFPAAVASATAAGLPHGQVPFPLPCIARCVEPALRWEGSTPEQRQNQLQRMLTDLLNVPTQDDPAAEECEPGAGCLLSHSWKAFTLQLISDGTADEQEFVLVLHLSHQTGDGMSGVIFFRDLLRALGELRRGSNGDCEQPATVPVTSFRPLSEYPALDDVVDLRPRVRRVLALGSEKLSSATRKLLGRQSDHWYDGNEGHFASWTTRLHMLQLDAEQTARVHAAAKQHGVTLHGVLYVASLMAAAIASGKQDGVVTLLTGTPFNARRHGLDVRGDKQQKKQRAIAEDLLGNFAAPHSELVRFTAPPSSLSSSSSRSSSRQSDDELFVLARAYLARLNSGRAHALDTVALLSLVDPRQWVAEREGQLRNRRCQTTELSNLGLLGGTGAHDQLSESDVAQQGFQLLDAYFAQSATYTHALWVNDAVCTRRGGLNVSICSPTQLMRDDQADTYAAAFREALRRVAEGEDVHYEELAKHLQQQQLQPAPI